jgi:hypothetical protein
MINRFLDWSFDGSVSHALVGWLVQVLVTLVFACLVVRFIVEPLSG